MRVPEPLIRIKRTNPNKAEFFFGFVRHIRPLRMRGLVVFLGVLLATPIAIVTWLSRTFSLVPPFKELSQRVEVALSDDDGVNFTNALTVANVNPSASRRAACSPPG